MSRGWVYPGVGIFRVVGMSRGWVCPGGWLCPGFGYSPIPQTWHTMGYGQQAGSTHPTGMFSCVN